MDYRKLLTLIAIAGAGFVALRLYMRGQLPIVAAVADAGKGAVEDAADAATKAAEAAASAVAAGADLGAVAGNEPGASSAA